MSQNQANALYHYTKRMENSKIVVQPTPIPCGMCDKVFFDNASLILHAGCHFKAGVARPQAHNTMIQNPRPSNGQRMPPVQLRHMTPVRSPAPQPPPQKPCPSLNLDLNVPSVNNGNFFFNYKPYPLSVLKSVLTAHLPNHSPMPINPIPPLNSSSSSSSSSLRNSGCYINPHPPTNPNPSYGQFPKNPNSFPSMNQYKLTSPSTEPWLYAPQGSNSFNGDSNATPGSSFQVKREPDDWYTAYIKHQEMKHTHIGKKPEMIIISDDEEENEKKHEELDLTLRL